MQLIDTDSEHTETVHDQTSSGHHTSQGRLSACSGVEMLG